jgi:elongation factor P--beta-lysine ligase
MKTWQLLKNNPELFSRYFVKEEIIRACRKYFESKNYHELESPILTPVLPQERHIDVLEVPIEIKSKKNATTLYITPTTERYNKIMLSAGIGNHFVITKVARGMDDLSPKHNPEFTMLEWYSLGDNYFDLMDQTEELFSMINEQLVISNYKQNNKVITFRNKEINIERPWHRISVSEGLEKYANLKLEEILTLEEIRNAAIKKGYSIDGSEDWQIIFEMIFGLEVEPNIPQDTPVFLYDYPKVMCPLTKESSRNPNVCEKVELYIAGMEMGNGYTELTDGEEQEKRFLEEQDARAKLGKKPIAYDKDLVDAIKSGMPEVAGIGVGLDRVAMLFANADSISDINFFPASEWFN